MRNCWLGSSQDEGEVKEEFEKDFGLGKRRRALSCCHDARLGFGCFMRLRTCFRLHVRKDS